MLNEVIHVLDWKKLWSPAFLASQYGHVEALRVLHELGADLKAANIDGITPAKIASKMGHVETLLWGVADFLHC